MRRMATIPQLFWNRIDASPEARAVYRYAEGAWQPLSWRAFAEEVVATAERLRQVGLKPGDRIAFYSENRYEWLVIDLAIQLIPAVHVPLHAPLTGAQARYQIDHSGASAVIVSGRELAARLEEAYGELPTNTRWFSLEPIGSAPWEKLETDASGVDIRTAEELGRAVVDRVGTGDLATILYTSGTTGEPKGVMLSQNNLATNALATAAAYPDVDQDGVRLCLLPLSHIFARLCDLYLWLVQGTSLAVARSRETVLEDCRALQPSWFNAVPYFFDKCYRILREQGKAEEPGAVRRLFGGRIEYCCCGGAGLPEYLFDYYMSQGVPVLPGYGLTESSPVISVSRPDAVRRGASGKPIEGVEVRVAADGEILTRGPHVMMGYYHDDEVTAAVIRDGWLYTGDYGRVDEDGFVYITGRKKEIIVTAGGKNVAPVLLESLLTQDPLIEQALVIGDGRKYLSALLVPNFTLLRQRVEAELGLDRIEGMCEDEQVRQWYAEIVERQLASLSKYEQVRRFALLPRPFSIEKGEMTPKLSLRRSVIEEHFRDEIESLYR
ncbi:MAG TPA: long-chain fatty acid--CoA ligase [Planctomycetaceae bacterium]|nr:long-chain fatty acid--CoA ligase [Planctomycetaceae bacterium]